MIMPAAEYITISTGVTPYVYPEKLNVPIYGGTAANRKQQSEDYKESMAIFQEARELQNKLRKLTIQAIPDVYIAKLRHPFVRYANTLPQDMLAHLMRTYGTIKTGNPVASMECIQAPWNQDTSIDDVFTNGTDCRHFASEGGNPINDAAYLQILITIFHRSGVMDDAIKDWAMKDTQAQTLDNAVNHSTEASECQ
jgi:hypothetical protein